MSNNELRVNRVLLIKLISFMMIVCSVISGVVFTNTGTDSQSDTLSIVKTLSANGQKVLRTSTGVVRRTSGKSIVNESVSTERNEQNYDKNVTKILNENKNVSILFDKNGEFVKAVIYNEFGKDSKFARIENGEVVYYKNAPQRIFSLRGAGVAQILGNAENNEQSIEYAKTISQASSWYSLNSIIKNGGTVKITEDLISGFENSTECIKIENDVIIDGGSDKHTITRGDRTELFVINSGNVKFSNIVFDGSNIESSYVAFKVNYGNVSLENCEFSKFSNNGVEISGGGVIYVDNGSSLSVSGCTFKDMLSMVDGGAIYTEGGVALSVKDSTFENISVIEGSGGAIYSAGEVTVENTKFIGREEDDGVYPSFGGAIRASSVNIGSGCSFTKNKATVGGAVYALNVNILNANNEKKIVFENNTSLKYGGAIYASNSLKFSYSKANSGKSLDVEFNGNQALNKIKDIKKKHGGGAIYATRMSFDDDNSAPGINVKFTNNSALKSGGAVCVENINTVEKMTFIGNKTQDRGGAIFIAIQKTTANVTNVRFENNEAQNGGAISTQDASIIINGNSKFVGNKAEQDGGAIYMVSSKSLTCDGSEIEFIDNEAKVFGGAIFGSEIKINGNNADNPNNSPIINFSGNKAESDGGAIYAALKEINVNNAHFYKNYSKVNGGDIFVTKGKLIVKNSKFFGNDNKVTESEENDSINAKTDGIINAENGGSIYSENAMKIDVSNSTFSSYVASNSGGAVYIKSGFDVTTVAKFYVDNTDNRSSSAKTIHLRRASVDNKLVFNQNKASNDGGAICIVGVAGEISGVEFTDNESSSGNGGAVYTNSEIKIEDNSIFKKNIAKNGGAVYVKVDVQNSTSNSKQVTLNNAEMLQNSADYYGGAVCITAADIDIKNTNMNSNTAKYGGAMYASGSSIVTDKLDFISNSARAHGGALYIDKANSDASGFGASQLTGINAINNVAEENGGAIYTSNSKLSLSKSYIIANSANNGGGVYSRGERFMIEFEAMDDVDAETVIAGNKAAENGGGVYYWYTGNNNSESHLRLYHGSISANTAKHGGGVYTNESSIYLGNESESDTKDTSGLKNNYEFYIGAKEAEDTSYYLFDTDKFEDDKIKDDFEKISENVKKSVTEIPSFDNNTESLADYASRLVKIGNRAERGGGIYFYKTKITANTNLDADNTTDERKHHIMYNFAECGGGLYFENGSYDAQNSFNLQKNVAVNGGGIAVQYDNNNTVPSEFLHIKANNNLAKNGNSVYIINGIVDKKPEDDTNSSRVVRIIGSTFEGGENTNGGAVYSEVYVELVESEFINNKADKNGGAVYAEKDAGIIDCMFSGNIAGEYGGAVYAQGVITVKSGSYKDNIAKLSGGAIYSENNINVDGASFESNGMSRESNAPITQNGGAMYAGGDIDVTSGIYKNNIAVHSGGAIYSENNINVDGAILESNGMSRESNAAITQNGGAMYAGGDIYADNSTIKMNKSISSGGAVYSEGGVYMTGSASISNSAGEDGGAIYALGYVKLTGGSCNSNTAQFSGGAVYAGGSVSADKIKFNKNIASNKDGGAIYTNGSITISGCTFNLNSAKVSGGAVTVVNKTTDFDDNILASNFYKNITSIPDKDSEEIFAEYGHGGAIYVDSINKLSIFDCNILNNNANHGGAVYIEKANNIYLDGQDKDLEFRNNKSYSSGGALFINNLSKNAKLYVGQKVKFVNNIVDFNDGGAIYLRGSSGNTAEIEAVFNNNACVNGSGGAIFTSAFPDNVTDIESLFSLNLSNVKFKDNRARSGAGVYSDGVKLDISGDFIGCKSDDCGAGVYLNNGAKARLKDIEIRKNEAPQGAGIYIGENADVELENVNIIENKADSGAGIYACDSSVVKLNGVTISENTAENGAGIYISSNDIDDSYDNIRFVGADSVISNNTAAKCGGGIYTESGVYLDEPLKITGNNAVYGGGIYAHAVNKTVTLNGVVIGSENTNTDIGEINDEVMNAVSEAGGNVAEYGGGIFIDGTGLRLETTSDYAVSGASRISGNCARYFGGGIFGINSSDQDNALVELTGSKKHFIVASGNIAKYGGALYMDSGRAIISTSATVENNISTDGGGAVYMGRYEKASDDEQMFDNLPVYPALDENSIVELNVKKGATIQNNSVINGNGGAVYFKNGKFIYNGGDIIGNCANNGNGGGIYINGGNSKLNYGNVGANDAPNKALRGGGIFVNSADECLIGNNSKGLNVEYNSADFGGGIYTKGGEGIGLCRYLKVSNNSAKGNYMVDGCGGGIMIENSPAFSGVTVSNNNASYGGGVFFGNESAVFTGFEDGEWKNKTVTVDNANINNNLARYGGGVFMRYGSYSFEKDVVIGNNQATTQGMGICFSDFRNKVNDRVQYDSIKLTLNGSKVTNNAVTADSKNNTKGGGIYVNIGGELAVNTDTQIYGNRIINGVYDSFGGGIYADANSKVSFNGGIVGSESTDIQRSNRAASGGGIYVNKSSEISFNNDSDSVTSISGNYASVEGGGIYVNDGVVTATSVPTVMLNSAENAKIKMTYNQVDGLGAAIHVAGQNAVCHLYDTYISDNTASSNGKDASGGTLYVSSGDVELNGCIAENNKASGSSSLSGYGALMYFTNGNITISKSQFNNNESRKDGGVIYGDTQVGGSNAQLSISDSKFEDNSCVGNGGAIAIKGRIRTFNISGSAFLRNKANGNINSMWLLGTVVNISNCSFDKGISDDQQIINPNNSGNINIVKRSANNAENNEIDVTDSSSSVADDSAISEPSESRDVSSNDVLSAETTVESDNADSYNDDSRSETIESDPLDEDVSSETEKVYFDMPMGLLIT